MTPDNFKLPQAKVTKGTLAAEGPAFKAMIIPDNSNLTREVARELIAYAEAGLPIILGEQAGYYPSADATGETALGEAMTQLRAMKNVHLTSGNSSADLISIVPNVQVQTNGTWYTTWRVDKATGIDYAYIYCDHEASAGNIAVFTSKTPYLLDTWTGEQTPIIAYTPTNGVTTIPLSLVGNETAVIAFANGASAFGAEPKLHLTSVPSNTIGYNYTQRGSWEIHLARSRSPTIFNLPNGTELSFEDTTAVPESFSLGNWTLVAEHWEAPANVSDAAIVAAKRNSTHQLPSLVSWISIPALTNASGLGYYSTSFELANPNISGVYLSLPPVLHAVRIQVNGQPIGPVNYISPKIDIGSYIHLDGTANEILVIVPSTMWNYLKSIFNQITNLGQAPLITKFLPSLPESVDNGLVGEVKVIPYIVAEI